MKNNFIHKIEFLTVLAGLVLMITLNNSCRKDYYSAGPTINLSDTIHYNTEIIPILTTECAKPTCHIPGAQTPDLTAANSYDNLLGLGYVDTTRDAANKIDKTKSKLYQFLITTTKPMPPSGKMSPDKIAKIEAWILQGALNN